MLKMCMDLMGIVFQLDTYHSRQISLGSGNVEDTGWLFNHQNM